MSQAKKILYITYDGLTDPLGQSQILPYIESLCDAGYEFHILSVEKPERYEQNKDIIEQRIAKSPIEWSYIYFRAKPKIFGKALSLKELESKTRELVRENNFEFLHCRSYISAQMALKMKQEFGIPYLFDMRGFWVDERVEGGLWNQDQWIYKQIFQKYKKIETDLLKEAQRIVVLTQKAKAILQDWPTVRVSEDIIDVIPCAADLNHFDRSKITPEDTVQAKSELNIEQDQLVVSYLGSIGTWYMLDEMLDFFKVVKSSFPEAVMLFLTPEPESIILEKASIRGLNKEDFRVRFAQRAEVPRLVSTSDVSMFFIRPTFSKQASSPTKHGELMAMGIPVIANKGVGDTDEIITESSTGLLVESLDSSGYQLAARKISELLQMDRAIISNQAKQLFGLESAKATYVEIYKKMLEV